MMLVTTRQITRLLMYIYLFTDHSFIWGSMQRRCSFLLVRLNLPQKATKRLVCFGARQGWLFHILSRRTFIASLSGCWTTISAILFILTRIKYIVSYCSWFAAPLNAEGRCTKEGGAGRRCNPRTTHCSELCIREMCALRSAVCTLLAPMCWYHAAQRAAYSSVRTAPGMSGARQRLALSGLWANSAL